MGIPGLSAFLRQEYPQAFVKLEESPWKHVHIYIDLNYILHYCTRRQDVTLPSLTEEDVVNKFTDDVLDTVFWYVESMQKHGITASSLTICMDGPPSVRKFQEQRDRRRNKLMKKQDEELTGEDLLGLALTPGTDFMDSVATELPRKFMNQRERHCLQCRVDFWDSNTPGEGEHKIATAILESERSSPGSKHVIVGGDADLVIIAMTLTGGAVGEIGVYSEDLFLAPQLAAALQQSSHPQPLYGRRPTPRGSIAACLGSKPNQSPQAKHTFCRTVAAEFAFLSLLGGNDYLSAAIKRPKKGSKNHMEWLLPRWKSSGASFMKAIRATADYEFPVWEFAIAEPENLAKLLSHDDSPDSAATLTAEEKADCEEYLEGMLWVISTCANGRVPSYLTSCRVKVSVWTLVDYLRQEVCRAQALRAPQSPDGEGPLSPLAVAACILPWRSPVLKLLGEVGPAVFELVQSEFEDLFNFERENDLQHQEWSKHGTWTGACQQAPEALAFRDLREFDEKVKELAISSDLERKINFSGVVCIQAEGEQNEHLESEAAVGHEVGDTVECFWPDDNVWLQAIIKNVHIDTSLTVAWHEDGSESDVPADYVRLPQGDTVTEPPLKRARGKDTQNEPFTSH